MTHDIGRDSARDLTPLFAPKGVVIIGTATHPGKFGFVAAHNVLRHDYEGEVFLVKRDGGELLGNTCFESVDAIPPNAADLAFICTPAAANTEILRSCAAKGIRAAFVVSAGYGEAGPEGQVAQAELVALCEQLGIVMAGPNGQGLVSPGIGLCAQIVAPFPPAGNIAVASQSGNLVSSFMNLAQGMGVGISRGISAGNSAMVAVPDYLRWFAQDPETAVSLVYVESVPDGRAFYDAVRPVTAVKPLVLLKGGATEGGAKAAASHTGALAADDTIFTGLCAQAGICRAPDVESAFDAAAAFSALPLPKGNRVFVLSTAGGWGVITADRVSQSRHVELAHLPDDLRAAYDEKLPPRWSRSNPADLAGGETKDTVPECLELAVAHDDIDAVVFIGLGIQSNQGRLERTGRFYPDHGLERICAYHDRQDTRYAQAAVDLMREHGKPILMATELAVTQPDNPGVATLRQHGVPCFATPTRAIAALEHMVRYRRWRDDRGL